MLPSLRVAFTNAIAQPLLQRVAFASLITLFANSPANAAIFTGSSSTFGPPTIDPAVDPNATFSVENLTASTERFSLGQPGEGSMPNRVAFTATDFLAAGDRPFSIGRLSYLNGQTFSGTNVSSVPFSVELALNPPVSAQFQFRYQFAFNLTPNAAADTDTTADTLAIADSNGAQLFSIGQDLYSLSLLGFSLDRGRTFTQSLSAFEDQTVDSQLFAQIRLAALFPPPDLSATVPEPTSRSALLIVGSALLIRRRAFVQTNS